MNTTKSTRKKYASGETRQKNALGLMQEPSLFLKKKRRIQPKKSKKSLQDLVGLISNEDAALMNKAIEEGCGQILPDDWR
jgi:hypothetical protein